MPVHSRTGHCCNSFPSCSLVANQPEPRDIAVAGEKPHAIAVGIQLRTEAVPLDLEELTCMRKRIRQVGERNSLEMRGQSKAKADGQKEH